MRTPGPVCSGQWSRRADPGCAALPVSCASPPGVAELSTTGRFSTGIESAQRVRADVPTVVRHDSPITSCNQRQRPRARPGLGRPCSQRPRPATVVVAWAGGRRGRGFAPAGGRPHDRCVRRTGRAARAGGGPGSCPGPGLGAASDLDLGSSPEPEPEPESGFRCAGAVVGAAGSRAEGADSGLVAAQMRSGAEIPCRAGRCPGRGRSPCRDALLVRAPALRARARAGR